jgi:amino acid transporter
MSSPASRSAVPATEQSPGRPVSSLKDAALRFGDVVIISMASSGPTQSIAVTLAALLATVAYASFLPIVICLIPMLGIAIGYQRLNAWQRSAGATYSWVGRALNPHAGFFAGWIMLMYYCVGTTSLTVPLGTYMLAFFSNTLPNNVYAVAAVGTGFDLIVLVIAALGIQLSARFQWGWAIFEYGLLVGFSIAAIVGIYGHSLHHTVKVSSSWFTISGAGGFSALVSGLLLAIFLYSGWDTAAYVSEEAKGKQAGRAGVTSVVILFFIYAAVILCLQGVAPYKAMQNNAADILAYVGNLIGGGGWKNVMIVAVLGGTLASLQAAIVSAGRISFAMGRDRTFPRWFGAVNPKYRTPWNATILFGLLNVVFLWGTTLVGSIGKALLDIVSTLGLIAAIFYLLTASAAVWFYRRTIMSSASNFFLGGFMPGLGAAFMLFVIVYTLEQRLLNGVQLGFGFGLAALGLVLAFVSQYVGKSRYFSDPTASYGDQVEEVLTGPQPSSAEAPSAEAPSAEAPSAEAPSAEAPSAEAPSAEAPSAEAPSAEAPSAEAPSAEAPSTEAPSTEPTSTEPTSTEPTSAEAPSTEPTSTEPS